MQPGRSTEFKVGIFVTLSLLIGSALVFTLGNRSAMFADRTEYMAIFDNVSGLRPGSPIRLAGIDVGTVAEVRFRDDGRCEVTLEVRSDVAHLVTAPRNATTGEGGTVAILGSKGLLGDVIVDLTPGSGTPYPVGATLPTREAGGMATMMASASRLLEDVRPAIQNVREFTDVLADDQFRADLHGITHNVAEVTRMVAEEDGTIRRLLRDPEMADRVQNLIGSAQVAAQEAGGVMRNVRAITSEVQSGNGSAHELIYGREGTRLITGLADTAGEAATMLRDVRTGDGNMHELLYGDSAGDMIENLTAMSADGRAIIADVRAGRGTIGAFLTDPSIYEDVKRIVGNLQRNEILRALVRYSIREDQPLDPSPRARPQQPDVPVDVQRPVRDDVP